MNAVLTGEMSWVDCPARIDIGHPPIMLPLGVLEQHGPRLRQGTDGLRSSSVAPDTARRIGAIVAPTLSHGDKSQPKCGGGQHFGGTTSVNAATLIGTVRDALREFARHGVTKPVIVNGHCENPWFLTEGIDLGLRCITVGDATAASAPALQAPALAMLEVEGGIFGQVATTAEVVAAIAAATAPRNPR